MNPRILVFALLLVLSWSVDADPSKWSLVYSVSADGEERRGDKDALITAVRAGKPIRVGWGVSWILPDGSAGGVEHVADAKFLSIYEGEVFAQIDGIVPQRPRPGERRILLHASGTETWTAILGTTGTLHSRVTGKEPSTQEAATFWYVLGEGDALQTPEQLY